MPKTHKTTMRRAGPRAKPAGAATGSIRRGNGAGKAAPAAPEDAIAGLRAACRVRPEDTVLRIDPSVLPENPRESHGMFELVPAVARRALVLGLSAREPSFHVFVAAEPEVMIEDDVVRYAARFSHARPTPHDIVYVHDFDRPEAPRPLILPPGMGPVMVSTMAGVIDRLKQEIPAVVED